MYKLEPVFKERIWGGRRLEELFQYDLPVGKIGECWAVSAHPSGLTRLIEGPNRGQTLDVLWASQRLELFGSYALDSFPLHVKLLDSSSYLSIQVHPNDEEARRLENEPYGKSECWYVLEADEGAEVILGHTLTCPEELKQCAQTKDWDNCLRHIPVKRGDFLYIPSGTIHALGPGIVLLEIQQMSDRTYRLYDYDRLDEQGDPRELHLEKALAVTTIPDEPVVFEPIEEVLPSGIKTTLLEALPFTVIRHEVTGPGYLLKNHDVFRLLSVVAGEAVVRQHETSRTIKKGEHFFIPRASGDYSITGEVEFVTSEVFPR
ncbi:MAG: type I phosphomannose isomerase catalytic subunit [Exiguobacterium oxidotolerans]